VHALGKDAIVWFARDPRPWKTPRAEIYVDDALEYLAPLEVSERLRRKLIDAVIY